MQCKALYLGRFIFEEASVHPQHVLPILLYENIKVQRVTQRSRNRRGEHSGDSSYLQHRSSQARRDDETQRQEKQKPGARLFNQHKDAAPNERQQGHRQRSHDPTAKLPMLKSECRRQERRREMGLQVPNQPL